MGSIGLRWVREGFGEPFVLGVADFNRDGHEDLLLGGRGVAAVEVGERLGAPMWSMDWIPVRDNVITGGDNQWVYAANIIDVNDDGIPDVTVITSESDSYLIDGASGEPLWHRELEVDFLSTRVAMVRADDDAIDDLFVTGGKSVYSGATGEKLWDAPIERHATRAVRAKLSGWFGSDLLITTEADRNLAGEIVAGRDAVWAVNQAGELLWVVDLPGASTELVAADLDGDLNDEAIVTTWDGTVTAVSRGEILWQRRFEEGLPAALWAGVLDGSDYGTVFIGLNADGRRTSQVVHLDGAGEVLFTHAVDAPVTTLFATNVDHHFGHEMIVGTGSWDAPGAVIALATSSVAESRVLWEVPTGLMVTSIVRAEAHGRVHLVVGSADAVIRGLEPGTGEVRWRYTSGGFVFHVAAADLDGDGVSEVVSGDDRGNLVVIGDDGIDRWSAQLDIGFAGQVMAVATGDIDGDGTPEIGAAGARFYQSQRGTLEIFGADGVRRLGQRIAGLPLAMLMVDLDGDGAAELVTAEWAPDGGCAVAAYDAAGTARWRTSLNTCEAVSLAAGDVDGDGRPEIGYGDRTLYDPPVVALLDADGSLRWREVLLEDTVWLALVPGGLVHGGYHLGDRGHLTRRDVEDGEIAWQELISGFADPEARATHVSGAVIGGAALPDGDVVASTESGAVLRVDGASGEVRWTTRLEPEGLPYLQRRFGGPVAHVPADGARAAHLVVGQSNNIRSRANVFVLDLEGTIHGAFLMQGEAHTIAPVRHADGRHGAVLGAGLGVYAVEAELP